MTPKNFLKKAWQFSDEVKRKEFIRANALNIPQTSLEDEVIAELSKAGWNTGLLMVALRILQILPSAKILCTLLKMIDDGVSSVPNGVAMKKQLQANLKKVMEKQLALAEVQKQYKAAKKKATERKKQSKNPL